MNPDKRIQTNCKCCGISYKYSIHQEKGNYCSNQCRAKHRSKMFLEDWFAGKINPVEQKSGRLSKSARKYLIEQSNFKCSVCTWDEINPTTGKCPLEIDHIDGNSQNCKYSNLRVLCPNCHSLTPTYKALNKGKGSKERLKYSKLLP